MVGASCTPAPSSNATLAHLEGFDWLVGCWLSRDGVVERWEPKSGPEMRGSSLTPDSDGAQVAQSLRIATTDEGAVSFYAQMGDQAALVYPLTNSGESQAVFERQGEGLQKITYRREGQGLAIVLQAGDEEWQSHYVRCLDQDSVEHSF